MSVVEEQSQHFQSQAVAMLAIATGAIGFGLFEAEFRISMDLLPMTKLAVGGAAVVCYLVLFRSVGVILESREVTGRDVVRGPLFNMFLVVFYVVSIFVTDIFDGPAGSV